MRKSCSSRKCIGNPRKTKTSNNSFTKSKRKNSKQHLQSSLKQLNSSTSLGKLMNLVNTNERGNSLESDGAEASNDWSNNDHERHTSSEAAQELFPSSAQNPAMSSHNPDLVTSSPDLQSKLASMTNLNVEIKPKESVIAQPTTTTHYPPVTDNTSGSNSFLISRQQVDMFRTISKAVVKKKMTVREAGEMSGLDEEIIVAWLESLQDIIATNKEAIEKAKKYDKMRKQVGGLTKKLSYLQSIVDM